MYSSMLKHVASLVETNRGLCVVWLKICIFLYIQKSFRDYTTLEQEDDHLPAFTTEFKNELRFICHLFIFMDV
jgi:hypothetical protein